MDYVAVILVMVVLGIVAHSILMIRDTRLRDTLLMIRERQDRLENALAELERKLEATSH